jgi:8-oxo-dGTP pyrophosphatase MutT (NUDIX family)
MPLEPGYGWRCTAFPERIPKTIMVGMADHRQPYDGDRGVRWEPRADLLPSGRIDDVFVAPKSAGAKPSDKPAERATPGAKPGAKPPGAKPAQPGAKPATATPASIDPAAIGRAATAAVRSIAAAGPRLDDEEPPPIRRAAGVLFLSKDNRILLLRRGASLDFPGTWCIPGGLTEGDETAAETAAREAEEETGRKVDPAELVEWTRQSARGVDFTTFLCASEPFDVTLSPEHDAHDWVDLKDLIESTAAPIEEAA